jgi:hypothetical protein
VAVWKGISDASQDLNIILPSPATIGVTETPLAPAPSGRWDRGAPLRVRLSAGTLGSAEDLDVLSGANVAVIGDGSSDRWEVIQFARAELVGPRTYDLSHRLRGQLGTDAVAAQDWPAGSYVVLLNEALVQLDLSPDERGLARHYRVGAAARGVDDRNTIHRVEAFAGIGLRCFAPAHLRAALLADGSVAVTWIRRTRIEGDSWDAQDVPLGEDREAYVVRVLVEGEIRREALVSEPAWAYTAQMRAADAVSGAFELQVAQMSDRFGPGAFAHLSVTT